MPYDKIDQLYDALKKDGAVSKSREYFRSKMLAPGKEGYQNRLQLYNALKADGAIESPTYEEFGKRLGLHAVNTAPVSKPQPQKPNTDSRVVFINTPQKPAQATPAKPKPTPRKAPAKQKGTPLTKVDKQKMLAFVNNMRNETNASLQRFNNRMDYHRANAGLRVPHVTLGKKNSGIKLGQNSKVVAKKPQFNPQSGKMEQTYITESGNEYTDRNSADLEQNTIDAYKDSMSVSGQLREAYAERDRLDEAMKKRMKEIDERPNQRFNDFMREFAASMTPGAGPVGEQNARMSKYDNDDEYMQLMAAARKNHQTIQLLEDKKNNQMNSFWHSLATTASNGYTFSDGMSEMRDATALQRASKHIDTINKKREEGKTLTKEEQTAEAVLKNFAKDNAMQSMYGGDYGAWARAGGMTANSLDFMKDLMLNPGAGSIAKGVMRGTAKGMAKGIAKLTGKEAANLWKNDVLRRTLKATGVLLGAHTAGAYVSNTTGIGRTSATMGTLASGEVGVDDKGNYKVENAMGLLPAFAEAERQQARENGSEMFGEFIPGVGGVVKKGLEKIGLSKLSGAMTNIGNKEWYKQYSRLLESGGYNGLPGEALEEYEGSLFDALTGHAGDAWDDMTNLQNHVDIWLGCATMGALLGSVPMMMQGHHTAQYYRYKHNTDKADNLASFRMTAERWEPLRDEIDNTDNSKMADVVTGIINNPDLHVEEKKAALNYVRNLTMMRGYNIAQVNNASDEEEERPEVQSVNDSYSKGYETTEPQDMNDTKTLLELKREQVAKEHGIENVDDVDALIGDDPLRYIEEQKQLGNTDKLQSVIDYANAKSAYDGMVQRVQDDIDSRIEESNATVKSRVNRHDGMIHPASLKLKNEDGTDKKVYIVSGNVVMFNDGKGVDKKKSDNTIVIRDVETGEMEVIPPDLIRGLDAAIDPEEEKARAREAIIEEMSQTAANKVDGVVSFKEGDTYTLTDKDGEQTQVTLVVNEQGLVDNGDGTVNVTVDGQNVVPMSMEEIQSGVDATNMARTMQAEQEHQNNDESVPNLDESVPNLDESVPNLDESVQNDGESVEEKPDGVEYGVNDTFTLLNGEDEIIHGEVQGVSDDGVEIRTDEPLNGKRVQIIPAEEFEEMVESINDADGNQVWAREYAEDTEDTNETEETSDNSVTQDNDVAPVTPTADELVRMAREGNELAQHQLEAQGVEWEEPSEHQPTALERVPINEATQEPMFEKADRETALDALNELTGGNEENTSAIINAQVDQATKALETLKKKAPKKKAPALKGSPMEMLKAQKEADDSYNTAIEEYNAQVAAAEENLNAWTRIYSLMGDRKRAAREQLNAERNAMDEQLHAEAVAKLEDDKRIAAEKAAEQAEVGTHAVNPKIKGKWDGATKVEGNPNAITLADGSTIRGHYVLTEAGAATASHDVNNAYEPTEGFPLDENGESVNDRDYKRDKDAQRIVRDMADSYDSRALQTPVIVSKDGVVLSGNNRTMSGEIAAKNGTDKAYVDHLREFGAMFGFTPEQIDGMQHPRVVFVPDEELPYDASTFARFNAEQQKKQSKPEHAVKLGKIVPDNVFASIVGDISRFDRMSDYYADDKSVASAISQLLDAGVVNEMQLPELRTGNALSAAGKELIENTLIGKVFQTSPDAVRQIISTPTLRQSVVMGLNEIANNRTLAKSGYDLSQELGAAVDLVSRAKSESPEIYKEGMPVSPYGRQQGLFDDEYGDSRVTDGVTLLLADILNSGKPSDLRKVLSTYNNEAASSAAGQIDMFSGDVTSKEEILNNVLNHFRNATPKEQQALIDTAVAERKQRAEAEAELRGENDTAEQTENAVQRSGEHQATEADGGKSTNVGGTSERQSDLEKTEEVKLSDEIDENGRQFVLTSEGELAFGEIGEDAGLTAAPILLSEGMITNAATNDGYGLVHIEARHGDQIRNAGYKSVVDFIETVAKNYDVIKEGSLRDGHQTYRLQLTDKHNNTLMVELSGDGTYWNINTAGIFKTSYGKKNKEVYNRHTTVKQPVEAAETSQDAEQGDTQTSSSMNVPTSSDSKVINKQLSLQENGEKSFENEGEAPLSAQIEAASAKVNTEPTEAQKKAGNYKKGHVQVGTFDITIEQPQGSVRKGTDANGKQWESKMNNTYGYIRGAVGVDGDHIDVFLSNDIDGWNGRKVFVVDQYNPDGSFDEHKVMLGFNDADEAKGDYLANYGKGWEKGRRIDVSAVNLEDFEKWIASSKRKTKPFGEYKSVKSESADNLDAKQEKTSLTDEEVMAITDAMKANAVIAPTVEINDANWKESVDTPIGTVKMGENQKAKLLAKGREQQYGMLLETLSNPNVVLEEKDKEQNLFHERPSSYLFVKTFQKEDGSKFVHFESVTVSQDGMEVSISSHIIRENQLKNKLKSDRLLYKATALDAPANTSAEQPIVGGSHSSDGKGRDISNSLQENDEKSSENKGETPLSANNTPKAGYTITPSTYTNKKGKTSNVSLLTFDHDLTADQERAVKEFAKERTGEGRFAPARGWKDRESGGWMFRSEEDARKAAEMVGNEQAVADNQPMTAQELRDAVEPKKPTVSKKPATKKPANRVELADVAEQKPSEPTKAEQPKQDREKKLVITDEMKHDEDILRELLGIDDDELDGGMKFRDPDAMTSQQRRFVYNAGVNYSLGYIDQGFVKFPEFAKAMVNRLGYKIKPWLKSFYEGVKRIPGYDQSIFTPTEEVDAFDVENFDKPTKDVMAQANMIVEEGKAQVAAEKANNELKEIRNEQLKETEKQTAANTDAVAAEAKSVASEATALAETSSDEQALTGAAERVDETLDKVNEQLALLGYYEADEVEKDYNEAYGYMRNAEKKAVKDAVNLASQLISDLNLNHYEASHSKQTDKKGNRKKKPLAVSNISPIGGDVSIHLPLEEGRELYLTIGVEPRAAKGVDGFGGSDLEVTHIMFRVDHPEGTGNERYGRNVFVDSNVTYSDLLKQVQREAYKYLIGSGVTNEGEYAAGDKVQYSTDGGRTWTDAVVVQPNDEGGIRIDTGLAPVMWVNAHPDQLRHKPSESAEPKHEAVGDFYEDGINEDAVAALPEDTAIQLHVVDILNPGMTDHSMKSKIESLNTLLPMISDKKLSELDKEYGDDKDMGTHIKAEVARRAKDGGVQPTSSEKPADKPKPASKKKATKKVKPEQPVGDLFAGLFDNTSDNGLQGNDEAVRTETVPADNSGQQQGLRESQGSPRKTAAQEGGRPDGGRGGQSTGKDRAVSAGLHGLTQPKNTHNNHSERGADHAPTSVNGRIEANIKAIELAHELLESGETATPEQMSVLRQFSGWGGLGAAFSDGGYDWKQRERNKKIRELLGEEAYEQAVMSANSAYYTPAYVVDTLWDIANQLGFKGGNILEGSAGIGNILGQMPTMVSERSNIHAIEIDGTSGGILSLLYPDAKVEIQGFEQTRIPNGSVDLAITNVPFVTGLRVNDTTGDSDLSKKFHNIHDFCIAKNVRKLREGGLGIFISSNGTLDNSKALRDWVVNEGGSDFIGAFRMNNKTFGGTTVTSDIIVIRKRVNGQKSAQAIDVSTISGERTAEYEEPGARKAKQLSMDYNKYFIEHPDHMAGEMRFAFEKGDTFRPTSKGLYPVSGKDQGKMLADFVKSFTEEDNSQMTATDHHDVSLVLDASADGKKLGEMYMKDGKIVLASFGGYYPLEVNDKKIKGHTKQECFTAYAAIKTALADVMKYQTENEDNEGLKPLIAKLNKAYDSFVSTYGHFTKNNQLAWLRNDVDYPNVFSLETYKEQGDGKGGVVKTYDKADVMKGRVVEKEIEPHPENVKDGVVVSMFKNGRIDVPYIANQLGKSEAEVKREIIDSGLGFEDPTTRQMEVSYQYLSGNVREKLKQAEANNENGEYSKNIKALQDVVPMNIPAHLIDFTLGSSWIDPKLYDEYVKERTDIEVHFTAAGGTWFMKAPTYGVNVEKNRAMGIVSEMLKKTIMGHELIEAAIQNKSITVSRTEKHYNGTTETITDREAMAACAAKIDEIRQDFKDWARGKMQSDADLSARIEQEYNDRFNNYVPMSIPEDFVPEYFGGATHKFKMRPHQGKAIVRGTMQPLMLAHEVGTGKTFTLISTAMEMRRLGTARKPMIVVQNATVGQFAASAKELYPNAKVLVLDDNDRDAEGRKNFYAKIKYNDWDMVIIPQSTLDKIPDSDERQMQFVQDKIDEKMRVLEQMREADTNGKDPITRRAEKELADLQVEMAELSEEISKKRTANNEKKKAVAKQNAAVKAQEMLERSTDDVENFDDMGIDALLIDEAHEYKHLGFATAMQRGVKGVDPSYSKKSQGVYLKTQAILEKNNGRNVIFATGTPISNTAAEIWTFMRYLMPKDTMKEYGIYYFDDFVRNFGNIQQMPEFKTNGKFKEVNRFAGYVNLPELVRIWSSVSDTALTKDQTELVEKIPEMEGGKAQDIYLPQTRALRSVMKYVRKQLDDFEQMSGKEKKENSSIPLTMYGIAQRAAVDARLVQVDAEDDPRSKTNEAVRQTLRSLKETNDYKGTVAIFADSYENKHSGFNLYEDIKKKLVSQGVPESEIVVMKSGMKIKQKLDIFDKVNRGEVRVILGSTATLGTGVNIQERLHTLIHLDAPNRPMDYTQRNGRILRQGNLHKQWNKPVRVLRFGVEDSLDVTAYQRLKTKGAIADSVMEGDRLMQDSMNNRVLEEEEDVFGDTVAQLSGSEYALLKNNAEKNVRKYESRRKQWEADQVYIHYAKPRIEGQIEAAEQRAEEANAHLLAVQKAFPGGKFTEITVGKLKFASVDAMADFIKEHNKKILDVVKEMKKTPGTKTQTQTLTLSLGGYDFVVKTEMSRETVNNGGSLFAEIHRKMSYSCPELGLNDVPVKQSLLRNAIEDITENVITGKDFAERVDVATRMIQHDKSELEQVKQREGKPFEFEKELEEAKRQFEEYSEAMKVEMAEKEKKYAEMDASVDAATDVVADDEDEADDGNSKHRMLEDDTPNVMEDDSNAMVDRVTELSERLHTPVRIIRTEEEVAALPSARQRRMKGSFNPLTGEVTIVVPNNANMADIENTFVHEVVGHDGLRVLFPDEAKLNNALDELYRVSNEGIQQTIDRMAQKMYDAEVDRIREKKRKEHEAKGEDTNASYYADMAEAHAEASKKREQFKRDATEEYGADLAGRIGEKGFEQMSAEELTFWGKLKAMLQKALQKLLDGLKIPGRRKWGDKDWAFVLHEAYKRKKNGGKPTVFDAADTEVMRRKTGFGDVMFSENRRSGGSRGSRYIEDMKQKVEELFEKARTGEFVGKPASIGRLSVDGKAYLEKLSGLKFKEFVNFVLNPSDLNHIRSDHYGENEKDKGNNVPLTDEDIQNMVDVLNQPDGILYGIDKNDGRKLFFFLRDAGNGLYNLTEVCSTKKGNLTAKSFFKSKKKGISQRVMEIRQSLLPTSVTYSGESLSSDAKIPPLFDINEVSDENVADEGIMFSDGKNKTGEPKPIGHSTFGSVYNQFKGKVLQAVKFLLNHESGDLLGVFHRNDVGDIDMVWGDEGGGLCHILNKHINDKDFPTVKDLVSRIEDIINKGEVDERHSNADKLVLVKDGYLVTIRRNVREKGIKIADKNWVLTAYNKDAPATTKAPVDGTYGSTAVAPGTSSDAKLATKSEINEFSDNNVTDDGIMFRDGDSEEYEKAMARDIYEQRVKRGMFQTQEAVQDSMLGLKEAMDAILKAEDEDVYIEDVAGYENAYLGENRLSSVNQAECSAFAQTLFKPLLEEVAKLAKTADERAELTDYMMAKHGLERNQVMARRAAEKDARSEFSAELLAAQQAVDNDPLDQDAIDALDDVKQRMQDREDELYLKNRERDFAGLTALTGMNNVLDAEAEAQQMVSDYESNHWVPVLWNNVKAVTNATLQKTYESGLINKATYDDISGMYENYIPLRGFDDQTSDEVYAYLADKHSAFNAPIKTAKGRKSKADDPFANMEAMAESAIMQGNRNVLVKQKFLNFALNHPSDLVSVSNLWLYHDDVLDEWQPINTGGFVGTEALEDDDSPAEVERKMREFEEAMENAAKVDPDHFKKQKDHPEIPYRVVESRDLKQHQVLVKRNGKDYLITINGNPRAAQALNGQTNPDNDVSGAIGAIMRLGETVNRQLSAFYTTRNPDFVVSNFIRDMIYANTMVWVKESPNYAWRFHKNFAKVNPAKMKILLAKMRNGTLDMNDETEKMFHLFMMNGGETGYANIRDIEQRKNDIKRELKKYNGKIPIRKAWTLLGERLDEYNRAVENCARFAAFMTSRQLGRTIDRSVYDAKEISVNFNKKGSGAKFMGANSQTRIGNVAAFTSGLGRSFYVFWNAAIQGTTNFGRQFKRHPQKAIAGAAAMFLFGALMAIIGSCDGGDDDDDKNAYYNLPEYVRRSNIVFRLPGMDQSWISMPLPVEYRAMYGMGELMVSAMIGNEHYTAGELAHQMASQVSQMFPIDFMEGGGSFKAFVPSAIKPVAEVIGNESWTGMPIYKDTPFNKDMPEWTKAYKSANKYLVGLSKVLNEATGGDAYTSGMIDINPAQVEYMLNGVFGGVSSTIDKLTKMGETIIGNREYDPRSFLLLNRLVKNGDERTEYRAVNNEYFRIKEESEKLRTRLNHYENDTADGVFDYAEKIAWLNNSPEYRILETYEDYSGDIDDINEELKAATSDEERKELEAELNEKKKELVDAVNNIRNGKQQ
jgi:N12 class adenine-specific DNA methylase